MPGEGSHIASTRLVHHPANTKGGQPAALEISAPTSHPPTPPAPATLPEEGSQAAAGLAAFQAKGCTQCHTVDYGKDSTATNIIAAESFNGPNLTHFASRDVFAGAYLPYEGLSRQDALKEWLANPPKTKPGSFMPNLGLTAQEIDDLIAWLETLS